LAVVQDHGRVNPLLVRQETGIRKEDVAEALSELVTAGWVRRVTNSDGEPVRGLYEFVGDPRAD